MENEDSAPLADIVTFVVVVGFFLVIAGIFVIPGLTEAGTENGKWGVSVDAQAASVEVDLDRLRNNQCLPGTVATIGLEQVITQTAGSGGSANSPEH
ncbi:MAG TPA: hypothetical protein VJJ98_04260 [Sedimentisphaerales bacterium]|nr:hypothetical protein [Sedimentisphaerales bacterium]